MAEIEKYQRNILRGIKRDFSKDEAVVLLFNQIKEKDIEIGQLKSFIDELQEDLNDRDTSKHIKKWKDKYLSQIRINEDLKLMNSKIKENHKRQTADLKARLAVLRNWDNEQI